MELRYQWFLDEGSGSTLGEEIAGNDATIVSTATSPDWITGYEGSALEFELTQVLYGPGFIDLDATPHAYADGTMECPGGNEDGFALLARFRRNTSYLGRDNSRVFFSMSPYDGIGDPGFLAGFYVGVDDKVYFGCLFDQGGTRLPQVCYSDAAITDDEWHTVLGRYEWDPGERRMDLWLDGAKQAATVTNTNFAINANFWSEAKPLFGMGRPNNYGTIVLFPGTWTYYFGAVDWCIGSFGGAVDECRVYCGAPTDTEIEEIFSGKKPYSIMFGCNT